MSLRKLQSLTVRGFAGLRRFGAAARLWVLARPRLAAWVYLDHAAGSDYRAHNGRMFADLHEHERMLADQSRMAFYQAAISRHIRPGDRVVDLGTGTGILAALASRQGAAHIYAIDHSAILRHARTLAAANGIEHVEFIATHSMDFTTAEPVDVIVHEQMGDCLFDEDMVANVTDLRDRLLKPGGRILPSVFEFYCEPIKIRDSRLVPYLWEMNVRGFDYSSLERHRPQDPGYYQLTSCDPTLVEHFLGTPAPVLRVDLNTLNGSDLPAAVTYARTVVHPGRLDGYAVYFRARVDDDLALTSDPTDPQRAPHWGFRILRTDRETFAAGDEMEITLTVGSWTDLASWRWKQVKRVAVPPVSPADSGFGQQG
ncbi:MAG: 50S ribosomal protein L11 methyltransferase [Opitutales bacterium]